MIGKIPLFQDLSDEETEGLARCAVERRYKKNTVILTKGDLSDSIYLIIDGRVRVYLDDEEGNEITIATYGQGECFGELALFSGAPRAANVVTLEESRFSIISRDAFLQFLGKYPKVSYRIIQALVTRIQSMTEDINVLALFDVYGRVRHLLLKMAEDSNGMRITERVTHQEIANMVGSSREMVSRILRDLKVGGYISVDQKRIILEKELPKGW